MEDKLSKAILLGDIEFLKSYLNEGGDFNRMILKAPDGFGKKPLELSVLSQLKHKGSFQITKLILENSNIEDQAEVLVSLASEDENLEGVKILLDSGISVNLLYKGQTALQKATSNRNLKMVYLLLSFGADPNIKGEYGSALELAKEVYYDPTYLGMMEAFLKGQAKSPFDFIAKDKVKKKLTTWAICLENFGKDHKDQTFYVLAFDGGKLKANSEESFKKVIERYREDWSESHKIKTRESLTDDELEFITEQYEFEKKMNQVSGKTFSLEEYIDSNLKIENALIQKKLKLGNPYDKEEKIHSLKFSLGDFYFHQIEREIEGTIENDDFNIDFSFMERLENDNRTEKDLLIEGLIKNQQVFTRKMNITHDFRIIAPNHLY